MRKVCRFRKHYKCAKALAVFDWTTLRMQSYMMGQCFHFTIISALPKYSVLWQVVDYGGLNLDAGSHFLAKHFGNRLSYLR